MLIKVIALFLFTNSVSSKSNELEGRVVRGDVVSIEEFPYSAFLLMGRERGSFICGSSIINQRILLTAAHCIEICNPKCKNGAAFVGNEQKRMGIKMTITFAKYHPRYRTNRVHFDIGLALLSRSIKFGKFVKRVAISRRPRIKSVADIAGWGLVDEINKLSTDYLHHITQKVISYSDCKAYISNIPPGSFCAGEIKSRQFASEGDSGSALIINKYTQIGIVSYKRPDISASLIVYTNVSFYYDWIKQTSRKLYCDY
ncbi:mast cell protease 1A-like [Danaus plexippus]|uniref:mast cell protease 1A-like n=1 Tax=Danaus plexippus TaxID=13037 RepID=UPI002AB0AD5F|nr:mast cell protease 1A-like [Danaus plexippus]